MLSHYKNKLLYYSCHGNYNNILYLENTVVKYHSYKNIVSWRFQILRSKLGKKSFEKWWINWLFSCVGVAAGNAYYNYCIKLIILSIFIGMPCDIFVITIMDFCEWRQRYLSVQFFDQSDRWPDSRKPSPYFILVWRKFVISIKSGNWVLSVFSVELGFYLFFVLKKNRFKSQVLRETHAS